MRRRATDGRSSGLAVVRRSGSFAALLLAGLVPMAATGCSDPSDQPVTPGAQGAPPAAASPTDGTGSLLGTVPPATGGFASVVTVEAEHFSSAPVPAEPAIMDQVAMAFVPDVLIVRLGQPVEFRNSDDALHNVHVVNLATNSSVTNVSSPPLGSGVRVVFDKVGAYEVQCNIHPAMGAFIIVTSSPYAAIAERDGTFAIDGVPLGTYTMSVWNLDATRRSAQTVEIDGATTSVSVAGRG